MATETIRFCYMTLKSGAGRFQFLTPQHSERNLKIIIQLMWQVQRQDPIHTRMGCSATKENIHLHAGHLLQHNASRSDFTHLWEHPIPGFPNDVGGTGKGAGGQGWAARGWAWVPEGRGATHLRWWCQPRQTRWGRSPAPRGSRSRCSWSAAWPPRAGRRRTAARGSSRPAASAPCGR